MKTPILAATVLAALALAAPACAQSAGDMTLGFGLGYVKPNGTPGTLGGTMVTDIGTSTRPTITFAYFLRDNIGLEVLGALPFKHAVSVVGTGKIGETKHLPPTVSINYHIPTGGAVTPFVGLGVNYTAFFEEHSSAGDLKLKNSWGLAAHLGVDYALSEKAALRMDLRYIDIDSDVYLNGTKVGKVEIDPVVAGVSYIMKF